MCIFCLLKVHKYIHRHFGPLAAQVIHNEFETSTWKNVNAVLEYSFVRQCNECSTGHGGSCDKQQWRTKVSEEDEG